MKLSVNLPEDDVEFLDAYATAQGLASRSAALQMTIRSLRVSGIDAAYKSAWSEWSSSRDEVDWEVTVGDGID